MPRSHPTQTSLLSSSCQRSYWSPYNGQTNQNLAKIGLFQRFSTQGSCVWLEGWLQGVQSHSLSLTRTWRQWSLSSDTGRGTGRQRRRGKDWKEKAEGDSLRGGESWASCLIDIFSPDSPKFGKLHFSVPTEIRVTSVWLGHTFTKPWGCVVFCAGLCAILPMCRPKQTIGINGHAIHEINK